jgi:uncharacterized protein with gpF-like domain
MPRRLIDQNPRREQRRQALLMGRIEASFQPRIRAELDRAAREMIRVFELTGSVPLLPDHHERLADIYRAMAVASIVAFGKRVESQGKASGMLLERKDFAAVLTEFAFRYIAGEAIRQRITAVAETTRSQIIRAVAKGFADGLGQSGVAGYVRDLVPSFSFSRSALIARTETHGAANYGANVAAKETGLDLKREWISAEDERTRESHAIANGQIVGMDQPFDIGGSALSFPGDPAGPAAETINCRCVIGFITQD